MPSTSSRSRASSPSYHEATSRLYGIENYLGTAANIRIDRQNPGHMRCPHPHPSCFARMRGGRARAQARSRPGRVRLANDGRTDPLTGHPYSSRFLGASRKARARPWSRRLRSLDAAGRWHPGRLGHGVQLSLDDGSGDRHAARRCRRPFALAASGHEMGQGIRTSIANGPDRGYRARPARARACDRRHQRRAATSHRRLMGHRRPSLARPGRSTACGRRCANCWLAGPSPATSIASSRRSVVLSGNTVSEIGPGQNAEALQQ